MRFWVGARGWTFGIAGILAVALPCTGFAQAQDVRAGTGAAAGPGAPMLIDHAVSMAISGSTLHFAARSAAAGRHHDRHPSRAGQDRGIEQQLRQQAQRDFDGSSELFHTAYTVVRSEASSSPIQQLYVAGDQYTNTLRALCGQPARVWTNQASGKESRRPAASEGRRAVSLSPRDAAMVALINQAVKEAIDSAELKTLTPATAAPDAAAQRLQDHARHMAAESQQLLQRFLASQGPSVDLSGPSSARPGRSSPGTRISNASDQPGKAAQTAANATAQPGNTTSGQAIGPEGRVSVLTLAQQARDLVRALQQIGGATANPATGRGRSR